MRVPKELKHGRLFSTVSRHMRLFISRNMNKDSYNVNEKQLFVLLNIMHFPGTSLKDICERQAFDKPDVTKAVKKLLELGYIESTTDENDKRISRLSITPKADEVLPRVWEIMQSMRSVIYKDFSDEEILQVNSLMQRIHKNLMDEL